MKNQFGVTEANEMSSESASLRNEAFDWIVRLKASELFEADVEALRHWRNQSLEHEEAFRAAMRLWRNLGVAAREIADEEAVRAAACDAARPPRRVLARRAVLGGAIAGVGGYLLVKPPLGLWPSLGELSADYRTGKGEQRSFVLKDDVSVQMNTETSLALRSAEDGPEIVIISGEAAITKTGASGKPLRVLAADGRLTTERASFDTRCVGGRVAVTCVEGSIDVQQNQHSVRLQADHQVSYSSKGLSAPVHVDPAEATSWRSGILVFHDRALSEVVDEINRYRPGRIVIMNAELGRRVVNGAFYVKRLDDFLDQVQQLFGARVRSLPAGLTLLS